MGEQFDKGCEIISIKAPTQVSERRYPSMRFGYESTKLVLTIMLGKLSHPNAIVSPDPYRTDQVDELLIEFRCYVSILQ